MRFKPFFSLFVFLLFIVGAFTAQAQTPGLIYKLATSGGNRILDPDRNGYVSRNAIGFSQGLDEGASYSEIPYRPFPALSTEPLGDLNTGTSGGHTDLAPPTTPLTSPSTGSPIAVYFDGTNLLFRIRLGSSSTASKGYSVLIDSDQVFDGTGRNPGFEFEVLLASNFAVQVIRHTTTGSSTIFSGSVDQYSQKAVAASTSGGNTDYFYDFYVPLTAFNGGITASTPLRMSGITITSAQSGITGTVSDVGGVNFQAYNYDAPAAWRALINGFPATSLSTLQNSNFPPVVATAPVVNGPIIANSTSISGSSSEAAGSVITVFRNGVSICGGTGQPTCPTVSSSGTWTLSGISSTLLTAGNTITATVTATGKSVSPLSNTVTVISGLCTSTTIPRLVRVVNSGNTRAFQGTTTSNLPQRIQVFAVSGTSPTASVDFIPGSSNMNTDGTYTWTTNYVASLPETNFYAVATPFNSTFTTAQGCTSLRSNQLCYNNGQAGTANNQLPTITNVTYDNTVQSSSNSSTWFEIPTNVTAISGTVNLNGTSTTGFITLFKNGNATNERVSFGSTSTTWTINLSTTFIAGLKSGDILNVRTDLTLTGGGNSTCSNTYSSPSNFLNVQETTTAPTITSPNCGRVTTLSGTSSEPAGTVLQFYTGGTAGARNGTLITQNNSTTAITATVSSTGNWTADFSAAAGGGIAAGTVITARAKASGKVRSVNSNAVSSTAGPTGVLTLNSPITEGATSVSGTGPAESAGAKITLYIEGIPYPTPVLVSSNGSWTVTGLSSQELFAGASVSATYSFTDECESAKASAVIIACAPPSTAPTVSPSGTTVCSGSGAIVTISNSERDIVYRLVTQTGTSPNFTYTETGSSVLGTGGTITLTSGPITSATTLRVRARKISGTTCDVLLTGSVSVSVNPLPPNNYGIAINTASGCAGASPTITVSGTQTGFSYELINDATKATVLLVPNDMNPKAGNGSSLTFTVASVNATTTYGVRIVNTQQSTSCSIENSNKVTYTVAGPATNQAVTINKTRICAGGSAIVSVQTNNDTYTYQLRRASDNSAVGSSFTGTGQLQQITVNPTTTTTYYVSISGGGCTANLVNRVTLEVGSSTVPVTAGTNQQVCGSSTSLTGSDPAPGSGRWTTSSKPANSPAPVFDAETNRTTNVSNLVSGTYTFTWTVTTSCNTSETTTESASVTVIVNCPASYNLAPPKYRDEYMLNDVLASATDVDRGIGSASVVEGNTTLPPGTELLSNGTIRVTNTSLLRSGTYSFNVTTVDQNGVSTTTPLTLRIYGDSPTIVPLPVELVYFTAAMQQGQVYLKWLTASETGNKEFVIQRSADGKAFEAIGTIAGSGNSSIPIKYSFVDKNSVGGIAYYRLKQVDHDGKHKYSKVISVNSRDTASEMQLQVYPNPFHSEVNITVTALKPGVAQLQLVDMQGRIVHTGNVELQPGLNELALPLRFIRNGMYILKLNGNGINGTVKVLKN